MVWKLFGDRTTQVGELEIRKSACLSQLSGLRHLHHSRVEEDTAVSGELTDRLYSRALGELAEEVAGPLPRIRALLELPLLSVGPLLISLVSRTKYGRLLMDVSVSGIEHCPVTWALNNNGWRSSGRRYLEVKALTRADHGLGYKALTRSLLPVSL